MSFLLLALCFLLHQANGVYQDTGNPYDDGELTIGDRIINPNLNPINPAPMHSRVFYPNETEGETYGVFYFVTGFGGVIPPLAYSEIMNRIAAHGYVVIASWPMSTGDGILKANFTAEAHLANIEYLKKNLPRAIRDIADFDYFSFGCHSAGCGPTLDMARIDASLYKATVNLEPVSFAIRGGVDFVLPSINLGAELANMTCATPNFDFKRFYKEWSCPRILMEAAEAGHCDLLTDVALAACRLLRFCPSADDSLIRPYKTFIQGLTAAFLNAYVQGSMDMLEYVINPELIPFQLKQHAVDMDC